MAPMDSNPKKKNLGRTERQLASERQEGGFEHLLVVEGLRILEELFLFSESSAILRRRMEQLPSSAVVLVGEPIEGQLPRTVLPNSTLVLLGES